MLVSDFDFELPPHLIAQYPLQNRADSRLLMVGDTMADQKFSALLDFLQPNDILVRNNTKVIPARLFGQKETGGKIEVLVERIINNSQILAMVRASKSPKKGTILHIENTFSLKVTGRQGQFFMLDLVPPNDDIVSLLEAHGHIPLPPYIERQDEQDDQSRYQTVYAKTQGAVAAPTAGLHFDQATLSAIQDKNISIVDVTLHVGAGTFQPVKVDDTDDHRMHSEWVHIDQKTCDQIKAAKQKGGRVVAVGTTSLRTLESASRSGTLKPMTGDTDIFITPGFVFQTVDVLLTNFHLPKSTLLMLVSAFAGSDKIKQAYQHAIENEYRFFSYGDAMLLTLPHKM